MKQNEQPRPTLAAWSAAAMLGAVYVGVAAVWIVATSWAVPAFVSSVPDAAWVEMVKGLAFITVTGLGIFLLAWWGLRVREQLVTEILAWREASAASERQAIAGALAGSVAHDINNVLMVLGVHLEDAQPEVQGGLKRLERLARDLQRLARPSSETSSHAVDLHEAVCEVVRFAREHQAMLGRSIQVDGHEGQVVTLPVVLFDRALLNLLLNAGEAAGPGGRIVLCSGMDRGTAWLSVDDDGEGVGSRTFAELAQPWHSSRERGSGLGLVTVQALMERLGGVATVGVSAELGGAHFELRWPAASPESTEVADTEPAT